MGFLSGILIWDWLIWDFYLGFLSGIDWYGIFIWDFYLGLIDMGFLSGIDWYGIFIWDFNLGLIDMGFLSGIDWYGIFIWDFNLGLIDMGFLSGIDWYGIFIWDWLIWDFYLGLIDMGFLWDWCYFTLAPNFFFAEADLEARIEVLAIVKSLQFLENAQIASYLGDGTISWWANHEHAQPLHFIRIHIGSQPLHLKHINLYQLLILSFITLSISPFCYNNLSYN